MGRRARVGNCIGGPRPGHALRRSRAHFPNQQRDAICSIFPRGVVLQPCPKEMVRGRRWEGFLRTAGNLGRSFASMGATPVLFLIDVSCSEFSMTLASIASFG